MYLEAGSLTLVFDCPARWSTNIS